MFGAALLLAGFSLGWTALRFLPLRFRIAEYVAATCVVGLLAAAWASLLGVWVLGYPWGLQAALVLLLGGAGAGVWMRSRWRANVPSRALAAPRALPVPRDLYPWLAVSLGVGALFAQRFHAQMLGTHQGAYYSGANTWGDLALHLSLLSRFAYQERFTWDFPILWGGKLSYPFLVDFLSGMLRRLGWSLQWALIVPGFTLAFSFVQLLYFTVYRWFRSAAAGVIAVVVFLGNGAPAGLVYFWKDWRASGKPLLDFLGHMDKTYGHLPEQGLHFSNVVTDYLLPQRSILFGLTVFLLVSVFLREAWRRPGRSRPMLAASAVLAGLLPFAHIHAFFVVMGIWAWLAIVQTVRRRTLANAWVGWLLVGACLAGPQVAWQFLGAYSTGFSHWHAWWLKDPGVNPAVFWFRNLGLALPFGLWTLVWLVRTRGSAGFYLHYDLATVALFALTNVYLFQPNVFDNMKFMVFSYLVLSMLVGYFLSRWIAWSWWSAWLAVLVVVSLSAAGALSIARETGISWEFSSPEDIAAARIARDVIPTEARVLTSDQHDHFIPTLAGRRIVMGYRGWLWSYGVNYGQIERDVASMYAGGPDAESLLRKYGVAYVCVGPSERDLLHANEAFFAGRYPIAMRSGPFVVYRVAP